jgi:hypothetical protein
MLKRILVALALMALGTAALADAVGPRFQVNTFKTDQQDGSAIAGLTGGGFVVTWESAFQDGSYLGIYAQRYNSLGQRLGGEFKVNTEWRMQQFGPSVTGLADGGFVITWYSRNSYGPGSGIYGRRYDAAGRRLGGEIRIGRTTPGSQLISSVASLTNGGFVVVWTTSSLRPDRDLVAAQRFSAGIPQPVGGRIDVGLALQEVSDYSNPKVLGLANGGFFVVYLTELTPNTGLLGRRYNASGVLLNATKVAAHEFVLPELAYPSLASLKDGGFVATWRDSHPDDGPHIYAERYDRNGYRVGAKFRISTIVGSSRPSIASLADGGFVVLYRVDNSPVSQAILGRRYDRLGAPVGSEFEVAPPYTISNRGPAVAGLTNGGFVASWTDYEYNSIRDYYGIFARCFSP